MKKYIFWCLLALSPVSRAQTQILPFEAICDKTEKVISALMKEFQETPFLVGKADDDAGSIMTFWVNAKTRSWTITSTKKDLTCVIGYGESIDLVKSKRGNSY